MSFRFRRSLKFGGVKLNVTKNGISSISLGGRGASLNIPVNRSGGIRGTVGIPGSGLSYSQEFKTQAFHSGSPNAGSAASGFLAFSQNIDLDDAQIAELASLIASDEAEMAAVDVEINNLVNTPEYKLAQEILANPEYNSAEMILSAQACIDSYKEAKLSSIKALAVIEEKKEELEILKSHSSRSSKLKAANIENRKMIGPIFAAFGGLLSLLFVVGAIGATFATTEPGGSIGQPDCSVPNAWEYYDQCKFGDGR